MKEDLIRYETRPAAPRQAHAPEGEGAVTDLLKKVRKVELKTKGLSKHLFTGGYHSAFKGRGMLFSEVRVYQFGDDVRAIDWNVTARTGEPHIKIFEEERELTVMLMVDVSGSSFFGTTGQLKQEMLVEICALLAFSAISNNDKVGVLLFADKPLLYLAPKKGRQHILRIIRELLNVKINDLATDLAGAMQFTRNVLKKRSVCFILSDFQAPNLEAPLRLMARRHDLIGIHCWDLREKELPDVGLICTRDPETGAQQWVDTSDAELRKAYTRRFQHHVGRTADWFRKAGADFLSIQTTDSYINALLRLFEQRMRQS